MLSRRRLLVLLFVVAFVLFMSSSDPSGSKGKFPRSVGTSDTGGGGGGGGEIKALADPRSHTKKQKNK